MSRWLQIHCRPINVISAPWKDNKKLYLKKKSCTFSPWLRPWSFVPLSVLVMGVWGTAPVCIYLLSFHSVHLLSQCLNLLQSVGFYLGQSSWWAFSFSSKKIWSDTCTLYSWNSWIPKYRRLCNWVSHCAVHHWEEEGCSRPLLISVGKWGHCEARTLTAAQLLHLSLSVFINQNGESVKIQKTLLWRIFEESGTQFKENFSVFHHELLGNFPIR